MLTLKLALPEDAEAIGKLHYDAWQAAYKGLVNPEFLDKLTAEQGVEFYKQNKCRKVVEGLVHDKLVGFCRYGECEDTDVLKDTAEIFAIYVEDGHQKNGYGRKMLQQAIRELRKDDYRQLVVWTIKDNIDSISFFEACGFRSEGVEKTLDLDGEVAVVRYFMSI